MSAVRVLHIVKSLGRGGAEMLLQETLKKHDQDKFEFHYLYFLPWKNQMVAGITSSGGQVTNFKAGNNISIMLQFRRIIRYVKEHRIDIIHCHLPWAGFVGRWVHMLTGIPVIYTEHNIQNRYHVITRTLNRISFNRQNAVVAVSKDVAQSILQSIHPAIPVTTILNGVNCDHFVRDEALRKSKRQELSISDDTILIGTIAVFRFQKRLCEWIDVLSIITKKYPNVKGCIVGDGILKQEIVAHLKAKGMEEHVILPGLQTDVLPWMSAFDIYMMSSSFEGLPIALLEAMSMGCAIVSTDAGGIKEVIQDGRDGYLKPVDKWQELASPVETLITDPDKRLAMGAAARKRVEEAFSIEVMVAQLEKLYLDILKK